MRALSFVSTLGSFAESLFFRQTSGHDDHRRLDFPNLLDLPSSIDTPSGVSQADDAEMRQMMQWVDAIWMSSSAAPAKVERSMLTGSVDATVNSTAVSTTVRAALAEAPLAVAEGTPALDSGSPAHTHSASLIGDANAAHALVGDQQLTSNERPSETSDEACHDPLDSAALPVRAFHTSVACIVI